MNSACLMKRKYFYTNPRSNPVLALNCLRLFFSWINTVPDASILLIIYFISFWNLLISFLNSLINNLSLLFDNSRKYIAKVFRYSILTLSFKRVSKNGFHKIGKFFEKYRLKSSFFSKAVHSLVKVCNFTKNKTLQGNWLSCKQTIVLYFLIIYKQLFPRNTF